jgi:hypothetical protein
VPAQWNNLLRSLLHASSSLVCKTWTREEEEEDDDDDEVHHMCLQIKQSSITAPSIITGAIEGPEKKKRTTTTTIFK